jgi:V8-like Glu-specific endopeptidase
MARTKPSKSKAVAGLATVTNMPAGTEDPVKTRALTPPSTEGVKPGTLPPAREGLEVVKGYTRASGLEAVTEGPAPARAARIWTPPASTTLRDIGEASFGPPPDALETVHGPDDRKEILDTTIYPWRAIASLLITAADNSAWVGTAWFVSPKTLITAGHCVYIRNSGVPGRDGWVKKISVMPGRNGSNLPYGAVTSTVFKSVDGWTSGGDENFDIGGIIIPAPLGDTVGVFGLAVYPDDELRGTLVNISGYPGDQPPGTQWFDSRAIADLNSRKLYYDIDTAGGQSGAPVFRVANDKRIGVAVHAYGGSDTNSGTRINAEVYGVMKSWMV